jgi:hypothetical protein
MSKYSVAMCEMFNDHMHGINTLSSVGVQSHWLVSYTFTKEEFMNDEWKSMLDVMRNAYHLYPSVLKQHRYIRNYSNIVNHPNYCKLDIVETVELPGGECVGIIKTNCIKQLQRRWRNRRIII